MSVHDNLSLGPVWVAGKGWVAPRGWLSPEARALMEKAQRECEEAEAALRAALEQDTNHTEGT